MMMLDDDDVTMDGNDDDEAHKLQSHEVATPHWRFINKSMGQPPIFLPPKLMARGIHFLDSFLGA